MRFMHSAWFGAALGSVAALLLCVMATRAAQEYGWFETRQTGAAHTIQTVRNDVYGSGVREDVYSEPKIEQGGINAPSNRVDRLYSPTITEEEKELGSDSAQRR
ncbi:hypothetical protein PCCS19_36410 [Paenibacillus sp. CCS19]|uniref:hypothetical protein n=1 Tax=Paenibacillus sp. CCS19 TaxID=3158387 RepID=UPI00256E8B89|nr:hypothetical protein [Paenibacillus cellulosilyticus]GMK40585.1 hypothetical protein PCCS19_36410 [Paenibacillus cellulosilyticus]